MNPIITSGLLLGAAHGMFAAGAIAGPYVNIESESKFDGLDSTGTVIRNDLGYEAPIGERTKFYVQGGPALVMPDGGDLNTELSAKAGVKVSLTENLGIYGEVKGITQDQINLDESIKGSAKVGAKYRF